MILSIQKWGNSHGIRLPKHLLEYMKWNGNEKLLVTVENGRVIIEKENQNVKKILTSFSLIMTEFMKQRKLTGVSRRAMKYGKAG